MTYLFRTILSLALVSGCAVGDPGPRDIGAESESGEDSIDRACDDQGRCFVIAAGWTAWAQYPRGLDDALALDALEPAGQIAEAFCYYYTAADDIDVQFCTIAADGVDLLGVPVAQLDYSLAPCAEVAYPWTYTLASDDSGECYGVVGPLAVLLSDDP